MQTEARMGVALRSLSAPVDVRVPVPVAIGDVIGNYRIERHLAEGGMGVVYVGKHALLPRRAAIKVLHASLSRQSYARRGLLREACLLDSMADPTSVRVYDAGILDDGRPWLAMELLEGEDLATMFARRGPLDFVEIAVIIDGIAAVLAAAHRRGVMHGDVKPENVMLQRCAHAPAQLEGHCVRLVDWGVARPVHEVDRKSTHAVGTPHYMAPEQVRGDALDVRVDIYALGIVAYELVTGCCPFVGEDSFAVIRRHVGEMPRPLREHRADVTPFMEALILSMLAKRPADRPSLESVRSAFALVRDAAALPDMPGHAVDKSTTSSVDVSYDADAYEEISVSVEQTEQPLAARPTLRLRRVCDASIGPTMSGVCYVSR